MGNASGTPETQKAESKGWTTFREYVKSILWAVVIALMIRTFVVEPFKIPSGSMENTLLIGDHLLANKFIYGFRVPFAGERFMEFRQPKRGDVVIFKYPMDRSKDFIKRVIGVPGDVITIRNKQVFINGVLYHNPHEIHKDPQIIPADQGPRDNFGPITVPPDSYFMMGDNRDLSYDSRYWGFVKKSDILGEAIIIYWSWNDNSWKVRWGRIGKIIN